MDLAKVTTSILAVLIVGSVIGLTAFQIPIPDALWSGAGLVVGFYFGMPVGEARAALPKG